MKSMSYPTPHFYQLFQLVIYSAHI